MNGVVYLRDIDGSGSMHVCAKGDRGAVAYVPRDAEPMPAPGSTKRTYKPELPYDPQWSQNHTTKGPRI